jgi:hypothetical protein
MPFSHKCAILYDAEDESRCFYTSVRQPRAPQTRAWLLTFGDERGSQTAYVIADAALRRSSPVRLRSSMIKAPVDYSHNWATMLLSRGLKSIFNHRSLMGERFYAGTWDVSLQAHQFTR